ncbi:MAG TPA: TlpA disulfide reductase family protein [Dehalococcoidia bacterium]|nr:TlpA disulfide reductase family protein [Dehalococcoidia bacterium]
MTGRDDLPIDDVSGVEERPQNRREWSGVARSLVLPLLIVATIVGVLYYVERSRGGGSVDTGGFGVVALPAQLNPSGRAPSTEIGRAAPDFLLQAPDGGQLRFSDLRGKPVLVNFWASWCAPCRQEMPEIVKAYDAHRAQGFVVVAVDLQENDAAVLDFARSFGMTFPIVIDRSGAVGSSWRIGGPIQGIPSSYFIDPAGIVRARSFGPMTAATINENLAKILQ